MSLKLPKRMNIHPSQFRSKNQERELARRLNGKQVLASGALHEKGDVRVKRAVRIEAKTTIAKSFSVTREMVRKIEEAAMGADELPAIIVEFQTADNKPEMQVAVVPVWCLEMMCQFSAENKR